MEKALTAIGEESIVTRDRHEILNADKVNTSRSRSFWRCNEFA